MSKRNFFQFSQIRNFLSKFPGFSKPEVHSLRFLNSAQFLGALNDNIYKLVLIFYLIQLEGRSDADYILAMAGAVFVIPFLLFSSIAGILADRFSKSRLVMIIKASEIIIMLLAIAAFMLKITWSSYAILFLLAMQSAMFGPSKYGIIPELVPKNKVSKANGLITSFTYLAIIAGTFLASFLTDITHHNYIFVGGFCLVIAIAGFVSSFGVKYTPPKGAKKKVSVFFIRQIYHTLVECKDQKHLLLTIFSAAFFLFVGGFTQLNIIPFAIQSLGLSEVAGGYLFLVAALGIACGALVAGRASRSKIELGLVCLAGIGISAFFFLLSASSMNITLTVIALFLIGFSGGIFIVPLEAFIQLFSPEEIRGHVIAASNFLSFIGVLFASFALLLFGEVFGLTSAEGFAVMGWISAFVTIALIIRFSDLFLSYTAKKVLYRFIRIEPVNLRMVLKTENPLLMLEDGSFLKAWLLCGLLPNLHLLIPQYKKRRFPWFERFFFSIHRVASPQKFEALVSRSRQFIDPDTIPCVYLIKKKPIPDKQTFSFYSLFTRKSYEVISVNFVKTLSKTQIVFSK